MAVEVLFFGQRERTVHEECKAYRVGFEVLLELQLDQVQKVLVLLTINLVPNNIGGELASGVEELGVFELGSPVD